MHAGAAPRFARVAHGCGQRALLGVCQGRWPTHAGSSLSRDSSCPSPHSFAPRFSASAADSTKPGGENPGGGTPVSYLIAKTSGDAQHGTLSAPLIVTYRTHTEHRRAVLRGRPDVGNGHAALTRLVRSDALASAISHQRGATCKLLAEPAVASPSSMSSFMGEAHDLRAPHFIGTCGRNAHDCHTRADQKRRCHTA